MAVGYEPAEISQLIANTNFGDFADDDFGVIRDTKRLIDEYGWHKGRKFETWLGKLIKKKTGKLGTTFGELATFRERDESFKHLYVVGSNLNDQLPETYNHEDTPELEIRKAVRISMSIPFYFQCVRNSNNDVLVDGGITRNYPLDLFDHERFLKNPENGEVVDYNRTPGFRFNHETLGFRLDDRGEKEASMLSGEPIPRDVNNIYDCALALVGFMRQMAIRLHLHSNDWNRTIVIDTTGVGVTEFGLSRDKIQMLIENGQHGVDRHFDWRTGAEGLNKPE